MLQLIKISNLRTKRTSVLCGLFVTVVLALLPVSAGAQCTSWDASGEWWIQSERGSNIQFTVQQQGKTLTGTATVSVTVYKATQKITGAINGTIDGDRLSIQVTWTGDTTFYNGKVLPSGRLEGETYGKNSPNDRQAWNSAGPLKCARSTRPSGNATVQTGQATKSLLKGPTMFASQAYFPTPSTQTGFIVLTWDAGPDHPNADVWVKYGRERVLFMKQPKGGQQIPVQRGQQYSYVLMDGRNVLATATVVAY